MLTWMQHHKKYLVVTIWISVIAFVGAGFVGWGAYDFNLNRSSSVAVVGNEKISFNEFNTRYNQIFNYYNQISNGALDEKIAKEQKLDLIALNALIDEKLLLNFAKDLGLRTNEDEILKELTQIKAFKNEQGIFDKNIYYTLLQQNGYTPKDFEKNIANDIMINKLQNIFKLNTNNDELKMLSSSLFMQDALNIAVLNYNKNNINIDEEKLKKVWQENKNNFKTQKNYMISTYFLPISYENISEKDLETFYNKDNNKLKYKDFNGKILSFNEAKNEVLKDYALNLYKNDANAKFLSLKDQKEQFQNNQTIDESNVYYPIDLINKAKNGTVLRPIEWQNCNDQKQCKDGYLIIKLNQTNPVRIKSYEEAREQVLPIYLSQESKKNLETEAKNKLENFNGINIGFVSRDSLRDPQKIDDKLLNDAEFNYFLANVFNSDLKQSYVLLSDDKAVLYKINKQKLFSQEKLDQYKAMLEQNLQNIKANELKNELIDTLKKNYNIKIYYKGNES